MADPKYENLPGIAYDQPDVYESGDLPEAEQAAEAENEEEENECIERMHLSAGESFGKFKGKKLAGSVDFSDRIGRKIRTGYRCGEWELAAEGDQESPQERLQRLKCETAELMEQFIAMQEKGPEDEKASIKEMASQMASTKQILDHLNFDESRGADPESARLKKLLEKAGTTPDQGQIATAQIKLRPDASAVETARLAKLEHRLHKLESKVGKSSDKIERIGGTSADGKGLIGLVNNLTSRAAALQPSQLDAAEQRLARLLPMMDTLKAATASDPEKDQKISELYDMMKKAEGISHSQILDRMQALEVLHRQANDFGKSMAELKALQDTITTGVQNNKSLLQGVQEVFANNFDSIQKEMKKLEERVSKIK